MCDRKGVSVRRGWRQSLHSPELGLYPDSKAKPREGWERRGRGPESVRKQRPPLLPWVRVRGAGAGQTQGRGTGKGEEDWGSHISVATKEACEVGNGGGAFQLKPWRAPPKTPA